MAAPIFYAWDDSGAPVLNGLAGSLNTILHACLVTGYGSKQPLGWTREFQSGNTSVYRPSAGLRRFLRVEDTDGQRARLIGYRSMTDIDSGVDPFPHPFTVLDQWDASYLDSSGLYARKSLTANSLEKQWFLIGNERSFYMILAANKSTVADAGTRNADGHIGFGELVGTPDGDDRHAWIMGLEYSNATLEFTGFAYTQALVYTGRAVTGGIHLEGGYARMTGPFPCSRTLAGMDAGGLAYPHPTLGGIAMNRVRALDLTRFSPRGVFPGWWIPSHSFSNFQHRDTFSGKAGSNLAGRTFVLVRTGSESPVYGVIFETSEEGWNG